MKLGWLVWRFAEDDAPQFYRDGYEPDYCHRKVRIGYFEIEED